MKAAYAPCWRLGVLPELPDSPMVDNPTISLQPKGIWHETAFVHSAAGSMKPNSPSNPSMNPPPTFSYTPLPSCLLRLHHTLPVTTTVAFATRCWPPTASCTVRQPPPPTLAVLPSPASLASSRKKERLREKR